MAGYIGRLEEIALKAETVRGTAVDPTSGDWMPHNGYDFGPSIEKVENNAAAGHINQRTSAKVYREMSGGTIPFNLKVEHFDTLGTLIMGAVSTGVGTTADPLAWASLTNTNSHKSFTVATYSPVTGKKKYAGGIANSITIEGNLDGFVAVGLDMIAGKEATGTFDVPAYTNICSNIFSPAQWTVKVASNYAGLASAVAVDIKSVNLNIEKNAEHDWKAGSTEQADAHNQAFAITGDFTFKYQDTTYRTLGLADTNKAVQIQASDGTYRFTIELPSVDFFDWSKTSDNDTIMDNTVGFAINYCDATNGVIKLSAVDTAS